MPWMAGDLRKKNRAWLIKKLSLSEIVLSKNNFIIQRSSWLFWPCFLCLLAFLSVLYPSAGLAGVSDVIVGHVNDIKARLSDGQTVQGRVLKTGEIDTTAEGQDGLHWSSGNWSLVDVDGVLFLQSAENFRSSPAPDLHVYISENPAIRDNYQFSNDQYEIGPLLKPNGAAFYRLDFTDPKRVQSILIWCKRFSEYIGSADLK